MLHARTSSNIVHYFTLLLSGNCWTILSTFKTFLILELRIILELRNDFLHHMYPTFRYYYYNWSLAIIVRDVAIPWGIWRLLNNQCGKGYKWNREGERDWDCTSPDFVSELHWWGAVVARLSTYEFSIDFFSVLNVIVRHRWARE